VEDTNEYMRNYYKSNVQRINETRRKLRKQRKDKAKAYDLIVEVVREREK